MITGNLRNVLERRVERSGIVYYISPLLEGAGVPHAFSTRIGPRDGADASPPPFDSFNLGNPSGVSAQDDYARIYRHYELLQSAIGCGRRTRCWVHQVHGGEVITIGCGGNFESGPKADAMVSNDASRVLAVRVADCVPVLLASADGKTVAAVHAGWRGVIAGVLPNTIAAMNTPKILAAIGPCISVDHFEVGAEVLERFAASFGPSAPIRRRDDGKGYVDLRAALRQQLAAIGVADEDIDSTGVCTFRDAGEFYSHRRDKGVTGRMAALISPR